jgi:hypothetical protein
LKRCNVAHIYYLFGYLFIIGALAKNGSFGFAKGRLVCRVKPNVPFVRLAKITRLFNLSFIGTRESLRLFVFKKCVVGKNKNTEALAFGSAVWMFTFSIIIFCFIMSVICTLFVL